MTRAITALLALFVLGGCATAPALRPAAPRAGAIVAARALQDTLRADVRQGFTRIYTTYDVAPRDARLSFAEFGRVVTRDWFDAHDLDGDGVVLFDEWHTPEEAQRQIRAIVSSGADHVKRADRDADGQLTLAEHLARTTLEIDPTPWLAGPADPAIREHAFTRFAGPGGRLGPEAAAAMLGALLAEGYYVDDGRHLPAEDAVRRPTR